MKQPGGKVWSWLFGLLGALAVLLVVVKIFVPVAAKHQLKAAVERNCRTCKLEIGHLDFSIFRPGDLALSRVKLLAGEKGVTEIEAHADRISVDVSLLELLNARIHINAVNLQKPVFVVVDGEGHSKPEPESEDETKPPFDFRIQATQWVDGDFTYVRYYKGSKAVLHIGNIEGGIEALGTVPELKDKITRGRVTARLEKSGKIDLKIGTYLFAKPQRVDVDLDIFDQNLDDVTPFFKNNDGISLRGILTKGRGLVALQGRSLKASVWAEYKGLGVDFDKTKERSSTVAFFSSLGTAMTVNRKNLHRPARDQIRRVELQREAGESLVSFLLRGLKEAALKVATAVTSS